MSDQINFDCEKHLWNKAIARETSYRSKTGKHSVYTHKNSLSIQRHSSSLTHTLSPASDPF